MDTRRWLGTHVAQFLEVTRGMTRKQNNSAIVVGSMNCMPTEYAKLLARRGWLVTHYSDADANDTLSNPLLRHKGITNTVNLTVHKLRFTHPISYLFPNLFHRRLVAELNESDLVILSGAAISLARLIKRTNEKDVIAIGYGDDVSVLCNIEWPSTRLNQRGFFSRITFGGLTFLLHARLVTLQRAGLGSCTHFAYFPKDFDDKTDKMLCGITKGDTPKRLSRYSISTDNLPKLHVSPLAKVKADMKVMFPVRFSSSSEVFLGKGWRIFIEGVDAFIRLRTEVDVVFYCFNKGDMLDEAKEYARYLGVDSKIQWLNVVPFEDLFSLMNDVDVIVDQLGEQWLGVGMWGALLGKPVISNLSNPSIQEKFKGSCFLHALNAQQFALQLQACESADFRLRARETNTRFAFEKLSLEAEFDTWGVANCRWSEI